MGAETQHLQWTFDTYVGISVLSQHQTFYTHNKYGAETFCMKTTKNSWEMVVAQVTNLNKNLHTLDIIFLDNKITL